MASGHGRKYALYGMGLECLVTTGHGRSQSRGDIRTSQLGHGCFPLPMVAGQRARDMKGWLVDHSHFAFLSLQ